MYQADVSRHTYRPAWWLPGPHLPTLWGKFFRRLPPQLTRVERWDTPDGDFLDIVRLEPTNGDDGNGNDPRRAPRLLLLHGLEGTPRSHYARGLFAECARRGWGMDMLVFRSCGPEANRTRRFYHSGETSDARFVLDRVASEFPHAPIGVIGVSLGGNVLVKLLGEPGPELPRTLRGAVGISVPFDLARSSRHISRGFARVYQRSFLGSLRRKALEKLERFPDLVERERVEQIRTMWDFDDVVTAPVHGFRDAADYYERSSALRWLGGVRRSTLLLSAVDDPFLPPAVLDEVRDAARTNASLQLEFVPRGGHVGFVGGTAPWRPFYYAEWRATEFLAPLLSADASAMDRGARDR
jgi:predicted alpha/beta-fold hydrolase